MHQTLRTGLAEEVVVEAVRRGVLGGGRERVDHIVLDLKTVPGRPDRHDSLPLSTLQ
jgi:hypothetical protein